jgi:FkbM family methyltransferase
VVVNGAGWIGFDLVSRHSLQHPIARRVRLIRSLEIDLVIDVGANEGQYARELRAFGYSGRIVSVEPLAAPFEALSAAAATDPNWRVIRSAAGAVNEQVEMLVAANSGASSSVLPMLALHEMNAPNALIVGRERVQVRRLDELMADEVQNALRPFIKIDVQGFESRVLDGAEGLLPRVAGLQVELQLFPLYQGAPTFGQVLDRLAADDFQLAGLEPVFTAQDGRLLAADGLFIKSRQVGAS